ncbi:MAG TPA: A/G-specific adenine glycosylase [Symbiobacteriaceae bacterium]|nr:A/G-specific adenine glycosylase [Symbiobacteriaceae bacterium]
MRKAKRTPVYDAGPHAASVAAALLNWFATNQRDLPWRRSRDPYRIWVSEVMLQQTRVETVRPYYERWFKRFPTLVDLAAAPEEQVLKAWEGLGYYSRARNLHSAAKDVVARYEGVVPDDPDAVGDLKGVGPYTAGAVLSIAYNRSVPAVDGNVMRVFSRLFLIEEDIMLPATRQAMESLAITLIPDGQAGNFNQALMELGALVCTPTSPKCLACPVAEYCRALPEGRQESLPVKSKAKAPRPVDVVAGAIWHEGKVLLVRRPSDGLLGGLWEFPGGERPDGLSFERALHLLTRTRFGMEIEVESHLTDVRHVFSHLVWDLKAYTSRVAAGSPVPPESADLRWVAPDEIGRYPLPVAHQKVATAILACLPTGENGRMGW